jgi:hypothetical protein
MIARLESGREAAQVEFFDEEESSLNRYMEQERKQVRTKKERT